MAERRGGRAPGTPNRRTVAAQARIAELGDPLLFLSEVMAGTTLDGVRPTVDQRLTAAKELARIVAPRPVGRPIPLPAGVKVDGDLRPVLDGILAGMVAGSITPVEAEAAIRVLATARATRSVESSAAADKAFSLKFDLERGFYE